VDIISLGIGDPDLPTPPHIIQALAQSAADPKNHQYPSYEGMLGSGRRGRLVPAALRRGAGPRHRGLALIGSKEGIGTSPWRSSTGRYRPGPGPGVSGGTRPVPSSRAANRTSAADPERNFCRISAASPPRCWRRAKILWLNYPNKPDRRVAPREFLADAVAFARQHQLILAHDAPYSEIASTGTGPRAF